MPVVQFVYDISYKIRPRNESSKITQGCLEVQNLGKIVIPLAFRFVLRRKTEGSLACHIEVSNIRGRGWIIFLNFTKV